MFHERGGVVGKSAVLWRRTDAGHQRQPFGVIDSRDRGRFRSSLGSLRHEGLIKADFIDLRPSLRRIDRLEPRPGASLGSTRYRPRARMSSAIQKTLLRHHDIRSPLPDRRDGSLRGACRWPKC
jgi:hypothetical protein